MDLWIRSQDRKRLLPINDDLYIPISRTGEDFGIFYKNIMLGHYKNETRALEVLDEIMELLEQEEIFHIKKSSLNNLDEMAEPKYILKPVGQPKVYKMPKE